MHTAYSYIRFSTPSQATGDSKRRQTEASERYARENGLTLDTKLSFQDLGVSAFQGGNQGADKGLGQFLRACETGLVLPSSFLIVESLDRLSRERVNDALTLFLSILKHGITIVTLSDNQVYKPNDDNWASIIVSITIMARAHEESRTKSLRLSSAWSQKRLNAGNKKLTSRCPSWMKLSEDRTVFELIPERAEVVKEIVTLSKNGLGQDAIVKMLNERNVPTFSGSTTGWHNSYLQKIMTNRALHGEYQPCRWIDNKPVPEGDPIPDYFPALITKENFLSLQAVRAQNAFRGKARKGTDIPNLFSGMLTCGYCGKTMILASANGNRTRNEDGSEGLRRQAKFLLCDGGRRGLGCYAIRWRYDEFETSFLQFCRGTDLEGILADVRRKSGQPLEVRLEDKLAAIEKQVEETQHRLDNLFDLAEDRKAGEPVSQGLNARIDKLEIEKATAVQLMQQMQIDIQQQKDASHETTSSTTRSLIESMSSVEESERFRVRAALSAQLRRFVESVKLYPSGRLVTPEFIADMKLKLTEQGLDQEQIDKYIESFNTEPKRQGRSKHSKYSTTTGRFLTITTKNGGFRVVYPSYEDASIAIIETAVGDGNNGLNAKTPEFIDSLGLLQDE